MRHTTERALIGVVMAISLVTLGLQAFVLRPHLWPAGAGLALSGETVMGTLAAPRPIAVIRPPNLSDAAGKSVAVIRVVPGGAADRAGIRVSDHIRGITRSTTRIGLDGGLPQDASDGLLVWRAVQQIAPGEMLNLDVTGASGVTRGVTIEQPSILAIDDPPWGAWFRQHLGPLVQMAFGRTP